jgi:hypothetical protein
MAVTSHIRRNLRQKFKAIAFAQVRYSRLKPPHLLKDYGPVKGIQPVKCPEKRVKPLDLLAVEFHHRKKR